MDKSLATCSLNLTSQEGLKQYNYLIVPGIFNELVPFYMTEYRRQLMLMGVPKDQIIRVNLFSFKRPEDNTKYLEQALNSFKNQKELVIFAHSKGALESLYFLRAKHGKARLKKAFLIQGPLDGSSSYKMVFDQKGTRNIFSLARFLAQQSFIKIFSESFSFSSIRENLKGLSQNKDLLKKITFIESEVRFDELPYRFWLLGWFYQDVFDAVGDGVLQATDQIPYELRESRETCRKFYPVNHGELVKAAPWNKVETRRVKDFLDELLFGFKGDEESS